MKHIIFLGLILWMSGTIIGQVQKIDSLLHVLNTKNLSSNEELEVYNDISFFYARNDLAKGLEYASKGLQLAQKAKNKKMESAFYRNLGIVYFYRSSYDTTQIYLDKALVLALEVNDKPLEMKIYVDLGNLYAYQNYQTALEYYLKALSLSQNQPDRTTAVILNNIANIHRVLKNFDRAISFSEQALDIAERLKLEDVKMYACNGLGTAYAVKGDTDKAILYLQEALSINKNVGNKFYETSTLITLSSQLALKKEFEQALEYCHKALKIAEEINSPRELCNVLTVLSDVYREMGDYKECERIALRSWATDSVTYDVAGGTAKTLTVAYIHLGEKDKAEYFFRKYYDISAEGNNKSLHESLVDMEVKYETDKKEMRIASLEKERQLYVWLGVAGFLLIIALVVVLWQTTRNARKEKQLIATRSVLDGEMRERTRLARDLHDRLSGNLSAAKIELANSAESLQNVSDKLDGCIEEIRRVAHNLMPVSLQSGLKTALEDYVAKLPNVRFHFFGEDKHIDKGKEYIVYCCAGELVNNSLKHSGAKNIDVQLVQGGDYVALTVEDDGCGFDEKSVVKGIGLKNIRERVASCGGKMDIVTSSGKGTETTIEIKTK